MTLKLRSAGPRAPGAGQGAAGRKGGRPSLGGSADNKAGNAAKKQRMSISGQPGGGPAAAQGAEAAAAGVAATPLRPPRPEAEGSPSVLGKRLPCRSPLAPHLMTPSKVASASKRPRVDAGFGGHPLAAAAAPDALAAAGPAGVPTVEAVAAAAAAAGAHVTVTSDTAAGSGGRGLPAGLLAAGAPRRMSGLHRPAVLVDRAGTAQYRARQRAPRPRGLLQQLVPPDSDDKKKSADARTVMTDSVVVQSVRDHLRGLLRYCVGPAEAPDGAAVRTGRIGKAGDTQPVCEGRRRTHSSLNTPDALRTVTFAGWGGRVVGGTRGQGGHRPAKAAYGVGGAAAAGCCCRAGSRARGEEAAAEGGCEPREEDDVRAQSR